MSGGVKVGAGIFDLLPGHAAGDLEFVARPFVFQLHDRFLLSRDPTVQEMREFGDGRERGDGRRDGGDDESERPRRGLRLVVFEDKVGCAEIVRLQRTPQVGRIAVLDVERKFWHGSKEGCEQSPARLPTEQIPGARASQIARTPQVAIMLAFPPFEQNDPAAPGATMRQAGGGQFNQTVWRVETSGDHTGLEAQLLTLHEWSHNELNNVSVYGALLTAFAQLARRARTDRERHRDTLHALAERSRRAHEVYATWYSTDMFLLRAGLADILALYPPEYRVYFAAGATLVEGIAGPFLRQQASLCAVRMCFSGAEFASHGRDLATFDPEWVRAELYPSRVLDLLAEVVPAGFFAEQLDAFLRAAHPPGIADAIAAACAEGRRDADFFGSLPAAQADAATMELHRWLHGALADRLAAHGVACAPYGSYLEFIAGMMPQLGALCDAAALTHPLVSNARPHDNAANLLLHMENEVLNVRPEPLPCVLWPMADLPRESWLHLATGEPAHFFFCVRHSSQLLAQHRFPEDQRRRLQAMAGPLVLLRRRGRRDGRVGCETLLFERPE